MIASVAHTTAYVLKFVANETTLQLWVGGVKKLEVTDTSLTSGAMGVRGWYSEIEVIDTTADVSVGAGTIPMVLAGAINNRRRE